MRPKTIPTTLHCIPNRNYPRRRGSTYIAVMGVTLIVSMMGMAAMVTARLDLRRGVATEDLDHARSLAQSALELGLANVQSDANWRSNFTNGTEAPTLPLDFTGVSSEEGTLSFKLVDEKDGDLADDPSDPVRLYGIGRVGDADYVMSVLLEPTGSGLDCLTSTLHADAKLWINQFDNVITTTGAPISTNDQAKHWGTIHGDLECVGLNGTGGVTGTVTNPLVPLKAMPGPNVWDYYLNNGTWIDIEDLPLDNGKRMVEKVVLSPGNNPFGSGTTNPQGIYVIDCKSQVIRIKLVRLVGTLVLLNPGNGSDIDNDQHWEPAVRNFPVLLVDGDIIFNWHDEHPLRESMALVNYNPAHTPYYGSSDTDQTDEYPAMIKGLIYISDDLTVTHDCIHEGVIVLGGILDTYGNMNLIYDPVYHNNPPPGFRSNTALAMDPALLQSYVGSGVSQDDVSSSKWWGQYFKPNLPVNATSWSVTSVEVRVEQGGSSANLEVRLREPNGANMPAAMVDQVIVAGTSLPATFQWQEFVFSGASGLDPAQGLCLTLTTSSGSAPARLEYTNGGVSAPNSALISGNSGWDAYEPDKALLYKIHGTYTTTGASMQISPGSWRREVSN